MGFHIEPSTCGLEYNYPNIYPYSHDTLSNKTNNPQTQPSMSTVESSLSLSLLFCFTSSVMVFSSSPIIQLDLTSCETYAPIIERHDNLYHCRCCKKYIPSPVYLDVHSVSRIQPMPFHLASFPGNIHTNSWVIS